jgi:hypothetical protein
MLALRILLIGGVALGVASASAANVTLALKPGLWQMTVQAQASGAPPIPAAALAHMTAQQKAQIAAARAKASGPHTFKECITATQLQKGFNVARTNQPGHLCSETMVSSTPAVLAMRMTCSGKNMSSIGTASFRTSDGATVSGTIEMTITGRDHTMSMRSIMTGKWLGADCAGLKPGEMR